MSRKRPVFLEGSTPDLISFLRESAQAFPEGEMIFGDLISTLGPRSFGVGILFFSIPMIIPMPPGIPLSAGFVITILGLQILLGRPHLSLPKWLSEKTIDRKLLLKSYDFIDRYIGWMFRLARSRLPWLTGQISLRFSGGLFITLGILMILPIPIIGNILPALSCTILALGLTDRDGLIFLLGIFTTLITIVAMYLMSIGTINVLGQVI